MTTSSSFRFDPHALHPGYHPSMGTYPPYGHGFDSPNHAPPPAASSSSLYSAGHNHDGRHLSSSLAPFPHYGQPQHQHQQAPPHRYPNPSASWTGGQGEGTVQRELGLARADQAHHPASDPPSPTSSTSSSHSSVGERPPTPIPAHVGHDVLAPPPSYGGRPRGRIPPFPSRPRRAAAASSSTAHTSAMATRTRSSTMSSVQTNASTSASVAQSGSSESPPPPLESSAAKRARSTRSTGARTRIRASFDEQEQEDGREEEDDRDESGDGGEAAKGGGKFFTTHDGPGYSWGLPRAEYMALSASAKKQLRNRVGAKIFREGRKNYLHELEGRLQEKDERIRALEKEVAELKGRHA